jgi:formate hydrogenlyase subunit 6/NADH:ubiquinone oxidoreductase subunit I
MSDQDATGRSVIERGDLDRLLEALRDRGYTVVGPVRRGDAIVYDTITSSGDLPAGWTDEQEAGHYRLRRRDDGALFGYNVGPSSWKQYLFPPALRLWRARRRERGFDIEAEDTPAPPLALLGVRACEIAALRIQDRVFTGGPYVDPVYRDRRAQALVIAVACVQAGGTCFCASMGTGPAPRDGFDLALTEVLEDGRHAFVAEAGSERGAELLAAVPHRPARPGDLAAAARAVAAAATMTRALDPDGLPALLAKSHEHPRWSRTGERCLTCGNCTLSCPTCFCHTVEDVADLAGTTAERVRRWDSCFSQEFSYIHGGSVRPSARSRYRQWLTHKLSAWHDQFGTSGCVGCGRCITWCPARIDITEEVHALRERRRT